MITPELKDKVLEYLIAHSPDMVYKGSEEILAEALNISVAQVEAILHQFNKRGFVQPAPYQTEEELTLSIRVDAHDYYGMGGHVGEFRVMELQFNKLQSELLALEKQFGKEPFRDLATATNTLIGFFQTIYHR